MKINVTETKNISVDIKPLDLIRYAVSAFWKDANLNNCFIDNDNMICRPEYGDYGYERLGKASNQQMDANQLVKLIEEYIKSYHST